MEITNFQSACLHYCLGINGVELADVEEGCFSVDEIRVAVEYGSVKHGTDFQMFLGIDPLHGHRWDNEFRVFLPVPASDADQPFLSLQFAKLAGASQVIAVDPVATRRDAAMACGADQVIDPAHADAGLEIKKLTDKRGVDVAVETSGSYPALHQAIRGCGYGGTVSVVGWYKECTGGLTLGQEAHFNQLNIIMSRACNSPTRDHPRWTPDRINRNCWQLLSSGRLKCEPIVTPVVSFDESRQVITEVSRHPGTSIKLGIQF